MKLTCAVCKSTLEEPVDRISYVHQVMEKWAEIHAGCIAAAVTGHETHEARLSKLEADARLHNAPWPRRRFPLPSGA